MLAAARRIVVEFLVVALGVLAALAADNWNDARKERQLEQAFLDGIALDMQKNIASVRSTIEQAGNGKAAVQRVIAGIRSGESQWTDAEAFVRDLVYCTYLGLPELSAITFEELRSTGSMRLLRDADLKRELNEYYQRFDYHEQFHTEYRRKEAAVEEALIGLIPLRDRLEISDTDTSSRSTLDIPAHLQRMRERPLLLERLEDMVWVQHRVQTRYDWVIRQSDALMRATGSALAEGQGRQR